MSLTRIEGLRNSETVLESASALDCAWIDGYTQFKVTYSEHYVRGFLWCYRSIIKRTHSILLLKSYFPKKWNIGIVWQIVISKYSEFVISNTNLFEPLFLFFFLTKNSNIYNSNFFSSYEKDTQEFMFFFKFQDQVWCSWYTLKVSPRCP